jgi:uncharacterized membrane protein
VSVAVRVGTAVDTLSTVTLRTWVTGLAVLTSLLEARLALVRYHRLAHLVVIAGLQVSFVTFLVSASIDTTVTLLFSILDDRRLFTVYL